MGGEAGTFGDAGSARGQAAEWRARASGLRGSGLRLGCGARDGEALGRRRRER